MCAIRNRLAFTLAAIIVATVAPAGLADAALVATATLVKDPAAGIPFEGAESDLGAPWVSYRLSIEVDPDEYIAAVDASINGPLHQFWDRTTAIGVFRPTPVSVDATNGDSHLMAPSGAVFGYGPEEDNSSMGSPLADTATRDYGLGTFLRGAWGIPGLRTAADIAYIVIPKGGEAELDILVRVASSCCHYYYPTFTEIDFFPIVPEPATLVLFTWATMAWLGFTPRLYCSKHREVGR